MGVGNQIEYVPFEWEKHLRGILELCAAEGWRGLSDPARARKALGSPGVSTMVVGFAQMQSDGVLQAHLSLIAVDRDCRMQGIGRRLVEEAFARCGAERVDLISTEGSEDFYKSFPHHTFPGYRIYPQVR